MCFGQLSEALPEWLLVLSAAATIVSVLPGSARALDEAFTQKLHALRNRQGPDRRRQLVEAFFRP
jgi:hypothetical protein